MPKCSICSRSDRADIDKALIAGEAYRSVAKRFDASEQSVYRHKASHLAEHIERAQRQHAVTVERQVQRQEERKDTDALDVMTELTRLFARLNKMMDACDAWLTDPENPSVYDLNPRSHELTVVYEILDETGERSIVRRRKAKMSELLAKIEGGIPDSTFVSVEHKHADPRKLLVETANALRPSIETVARLMGQLNDRQVNVIVSPEWMRLRSAVLLALDPFPDARGAVVARMASLKAPSDG